MRHLAILGLAAVVTAGCEDPTSPQNAAQPTSFSIDAVLSNDLLVSGAPPITYSVDFGKSFSSISKVDYFFTLGDDALDPEECLAFSRDGSSFGFGICNVGSAPQTSRLLTFPCDIHGAVCDHFRDGVSTGTMYVNRGGPGSASVRITSLTITVQGTVTVPVAMDIQPNSFPNTINPRSGGVVAVALLTTATFHATTIDLLSGRVGRSGATEAHSRSG